jgi:SAM-dependent methyltransferase
MNEVSSCPVCSSTHISSILRIERLPACCNRLYRSRGDAIGALRGTVDLAACQGCGHIFNRTFDGSLVDYDAQYENSLYSSERFRRYADELVEELVRRHELKARTIVEIGCGRGEFLRALCRRGPNRGVGFDPSYKPDDQGEEQGGTPEISIRREVFCHNTGTPRADFICSRHTLEHVEEPRELLRNIRAGTGERYIPLYFEVPNSLTMLSGGCIWDIVYEHFSYFSTSSLSRLFVDAGFCVDDIRQVFGGQYLALHGRTGSGHEKQAWSRPAAFENEVAKFAGTFTETVEKWKLRLDALARDGRRAVVWGAGSKGGTFLNLLGETHIDYVVDRNYRKQGHFIAGTGQRIVSPEFLHNIPVDVIICMNPMYSAEIKAEMESVGLRADIVQA